MPPLAGTSISELVTKKAHLLGVGKEKNWELLGMSNDDLVMIDSLRRKFPGKIKGSFCYECVHTMRGHCILCQGDFYTEMATCLACEDRGNGTLQHAGNHTERAGISTLSKIIHDGYENCLKITMSVN